MPFHFEAFSLLLYHITSQQITPQNITSYHTLGCCFYVISCCFLLILSYHIVSWVSIYFVYCIIFIALHCIVLQVSYCFESYHTILLLPNVISYHTDCIWILLIVAYCVMLHWSCRVVLYCTISICVVIHRLQLYQMCNLHYSCGMIWLKSVHRLQYYLMQFLWQKSPKWTQNMISIVWFTRSLTPEVWTRSSEFVWSVFPRAEHKWGTWTVDWQGN